MSCLRLYSIDLPISIRPGMHSLEYGRVVVVPEIIRLSDGLS